MINNHQIGLEFLLKEFGVKPRIGWQIDPFGHSNTNARFFAEMGFDALFFGRMDWGDDSTREIEKAYEFIWQPNKDTKKHDLGNQIFTHKIWETYDWTPGPSFMFHDEGSSISRPFITDKNSAEFNADVIAAQVIKTLDETKSIKYLHDEIFQPWGGDFMYFNAFWNFESLDKLIDYVNENYGDRYHFKYSTPSEYVDAVAKYNITWPTK